MTRHVAVLVDATKSLVIAVEAPTPAVTFQHLGQTFGWSFVLASLHAGVLRGHRRGHIQAAICRTICSASCWKGNLPHKIRAVAVNVPAFVAAHVVWTAGINMSVLSLLST